MLSHYQTELMKDLQSSDSYGTPLVGWNGQAAIYRAPNAPPNLQSLASELFLTFVESTYFLIKTRRAIRIYRGYETEGLTAPYGQDHPSYIQGLVASRNPGRPDGKWWTPARPSAEIDNLRLSELQRTDARVGAAIKLEWNRLDFFIESELPIGSLVYAGRTAPQQESKIYGGKKLGGGAMQFRLISDPAVALSWMKRYVAS